VYVTSNFLRYPLLVRELLRQTEKTHKDYPNLEKAAERIESVVALVNEATDALDKKEKVVNIQNRIESTLVSFFAFHDNYQFQF
jgi:hypothetical protein